MQRLVDIAPAQIPQIWALLSQIPDPEVPVLTITDLGMVRSVKARGEGVPAGVSCPRCASTDTSLISEFGSTACKALYRCNTCREPFDYFKCI